MGFLAGNTPEERAEMAYSTQGLVFNKQIIVNQSLI